MKKITMNVLALSLLAACASQDDAAQVNVAEPANDNKQNVADTKKKKDEDKRGHPPRPMTESRLSMILDEYNANDDQQLTWDEYNTWRRARFDATDADNNGTVDTEEYVYEFEERLDEGYEEARKAQVKQTERRFKALDKDDNAVITWAEIQSSGERIFKRWDSNEDGVIDENDASFAKKSGYGKYGEGKHKHDHKDKDGKKKAEKGDDYKAKDKYAKGKDGKKAAKKRRRFSFIRMPTTHTRKGLLKLYDSNEDNKVTADEFNHARRSTFHLTDQNRDGKLNFDEYLAEYEDRLDKAISDSRRASIRQTYVRFNVLDDNEDESMTFDEFQISGKRIFGRWDKNEDGVISQADIAE